MGNVLVVQQIRAKWTKAARGGDSAAWRNAVPDVARVLVQRITTGDLVVAHHLISYGEHDKFAQPHEEVRVNAPARPLVIGCVSVDHDAEEASMTFRYDEKCGGAPNRDWMQHTFCLAVNEWGQMVYNGRFSLYHSGWASAWWYEKIVVNVGLFHRIVPSVFTKNAPTRRFASIAKLF